MEVIPVINCPDAECARQKVEAAKTFLTPGTVVHLDVTDGVFAAHNTWNDPAGWAALGTPFALEVHLMAEHPEALAPAWIAAGARRLIVHAEAIAARAAEDENFLNKFLQLCAEHGTQVMLSSNPDTPVEVLAPWLAHFKMFQVLAVHPGPAAQGFLPEAAEKIKKLRAAAGADAIIEVDGGINPETARIVRDAGANIIVSANYIFSAADPKAAYEALAGI